jgi:hypothetical protein
MRLSHGFDGSFGWCRAQHGWMLAAMGELYKMNRFLRLELGVRTACVLLRCDEMR